MNYPCFFKHDTAYAVLLSHDDYIIVRRLVTSIEIKYGPNINVVEEIKDRYKPSTEQEFLKEFEKRVTTLTEKYETLFIGAVAG